LVRALFCAILGFGSVSLIQTDHLLLRWFKSAEYQSQLETALMRDWSQSVQSNEQQRASGSRGTTNETGIPRTSAVSVVVVPPSSPQPRAQPLPPRKYAKVIEWNHKKHLKTFMSTYFREKNLVCDLFPPTAATNNDDDRSRANLTRQPQDNLRLSSSHYLLNVTFGCHELFYRSGLGSGNYLAGLYAIRLAAQALSLSSSTEDRNESNRRIILDVRISCPDADQEKANLILPWLTGFFRSPDDGGGENEDDKGSTLEDSLLSSRMRRYGGVMGQDACNNIDSCPIGYLYPDIQTELRRMAVRMVGFPPPDHSTHDRVIRWLAEVNSAGQNRPGRTSTYQLQLPIPTAEELEERPPLYPGVQLDDAVIHFRCGDLMDSDHPRYGFLSFPSLVSQLASTVRSIGVVTQPYNDESHQSRAWDNTAIKRRRCRIVVTDLVDYLTGRFPAARVTVHNRPDDTIALTYARMILANQTIAGISTFGVFPAIASFGTGYIRRPDPLSPTNGWLVHPPLDGLVKNVVLIEDPNVLKVRTIKKLWNLENGQEQILAWFRGGNWTDTILSLQESVEREREDRAVRAAPLTNGPEETEPSTGQ
jgi:hypothetical protein